MFDNSDKPLSFEDVWEIEDPFMNAAPRPDVLSTHSSENAPVIAPPQSRKRTSLGPGPTIFTIPEQRSSSPQTMEDTLMTESPDRYTAFQVPPNATSRGHGRTVSSISYFAQQDNPFFRPLPPRDRSVQTRRVAVVPQDNPFLRGVLLPYTSAENRPAAAPAALMQQQIRKSIKTSQSPVPPSHHHLSLPQRPRLRSAISSPALFNRYSAELISPKSSETVYRLGYSSKSLTGNLPFELFRLRFPLLEANTHAKALAEECCADGEQVELDEVKEDGEEVWVVRRKVNRGRGRGGLLYGYANGDEEWNVVVKVDVCASEKVRMDWKRWKKSFGKRIAL